MTGVYIAITSLALYGDLLKRYLSADTALIIQYAIALLIPITITMSKRGRRVARLGRDAKEVSRLAAILIAIYLAQAVIPGEASFRDALTHALYVSIPLLYILAILRYSGNFDLFRLGAVFLILMVPVNVVGVIQYLFDSSFLITSTYTPTGGIITRGIFDLGHFQRLPSVFASADRYSSMGLMQFYFALILLLSQLATSLKRIWWPVANLACGLVALVISGARSRMLLVMFLVILVTAAILRPRLAKSYFRRLGRVLAGIVISLALVVIIGASLGIDVYGWVMERPFVRFMAATFQEGDVQHRVGKALEYSHIRRETTLFGRGLGSVIEGGAPGEFGIRTMWIESGIVWGTMTLLAFFGLILKLGLKCMAGLRRGVPVKVAIFAVPVLVLVSALLVGLRFAFELSTGVVLMSAIAGAMLAEVGEEGAHRRRERVVTATRRY